MSDHHDWHSDEYVSGWIDGDVTSDGTRRPRLRELITSAGLASDAPLQVIDVGAGYGVFSEEVLHALSGARVTLLDYSRPMLAQARSRLSSLAERTSFRTGDLATPAWVEPLGLFSLAVSSLVIHNLNSLGRIPEIYAEIGSRLEPGGVFLNYDLVSFTGGLSQHEDWLRAAGFDDIECWMINAGTAAMRARLSH